MDSVLYSVEVGVSIFFVRLWGRDGYISFHRHFCITFCRFSAGFRFNTDLDFTISENEFNVLVRNNRIAAVGRQGSLNIPGGAEIVDVSGKTIVPGFVDAHAHMWPQWGVHRPDQWMYLANLAYGVTATRDPQTSTTAVLFTLVVALLFFALWA